MCLAIVSKMTFPIVGGCKGSGLDKLVQGIWDEDGMDNLWERLSSAGVKILCAMGGGVLILNERTVLVITKEPPHGVRFL